MYDLQDFEQDVIVQSQTLPVLVDFWAPWCGPCRTLGPILEKIAAEQPERFRLVKINSDENQELAQQFGIRGIPAVKLVYKGQFLGEFTGAQPESAVRTFLDQHLPAPGSDGDSAEELPTEEASLEEVDRLMKEGQSELALAMIKDLNAQNPEDLAARFMAARLLVIQSPEEALKLCDSLDGEGGIDLFGLEQIKHLAYFLSDPEEKKYPESPGKEPYFAAKTALLNGQIEVAIENFIDVILKDRYFDEDASRKTIISLFTILGPEHPVTLKYRRDFDRSLY